MYYLASCNYTSAVVHSRHISGNATEALELQSRLQIMEPVTSRLQSVEPVTPLVTKRTTYIVTQEDRNSIMSFPG